MPSYSQQQEEYVLIREWGSRGAAPGQFSQPADITIDSKGNVFVTDITARSNAVQKFNQNGTLLHNLHLAIINKMIANYFSIKED